MRIIRASASFGKLNGDTIEFSPGLNVIPMENEGGKSTWCAFIRTMLYGLRTNERVTKAAIPDKSRYLPWSGEMMGGTLLIEHGGREIMIERSHSKAGPMQAFRAYYPSSGEDVPDLTSSNCGEVLCGVGREAFEKSAFISSSEVIVKGGSSELEKKIQSLASGAEEDISFSDTDENLERFRKDIKSVRGAGELSKSEKEREDKKARLALSRELGHKGAALRAKALALLKEREELSSKINLIKQHDSARASSKIAAAAADKERAEEALCSAKEALSFGDFTVDGAFAEKAGELKRALSEATAVEGSFRDAQAKAEKAVEDARSAFNEKRDSLPMFKQTLDKAYAVSAIILGLLFLAMGLILKSSFPPALPIGIGLFALSFVAVVVIFLISDKKMQDYKAKCEEQLSSERAVLSEKRAVLKQAQVSLIEKEEERGKIFSELREFLSPIKADIQTPDDAIAAVSGITAALEKAKEASRAINAAEGTISALKGSYQGENVPAPSEPRPEGDLADYERALSDVSRSYESAITDAAIAEGRGQSAGDADIIEGEICALDEKINELSFRLEAIDIAKAALFSANEELVSRISPELSKRAGEYFEKLTLGKYDSVLIRRGFEMLCSDGDAGAMRSIMDLSSGTADQLYLSLRLALCDLVLPEGEGGFPPVVLDDALLSFDDERLSSAMRVLKELSEKRQIILFSCTTREKEALLSI